MPKTLVPRILAPPSIKRNIIANYVGLGSASLLSLLMVPVYIRYLGIEAFALVGLFAVIQGWMALLDLGMAPTLGREMARYTAGTLSVQAVRDLLRSLEIVYLGIAVATVLVLSQFAGSIASGWLNVEKMPIDSVVGALSMLGIVVALRFCEGIYRSAIMGLQQQVWLNQVSVILSLLRTLGALAVLALIAPTVQAFFVWQGLISLTSLIILAARIQSTLPPAPRPARFSLAALEQVRRFAGGLFLTSLLFLMLTQVDKLLLSRLLSLTDFGYYMIAATISNGAWLFGAPIVLAVSPALVKLHEATDRDGLAGAYHKAAQLVALLAGPASLMMIVYAYGMLFAWSGDAAIATRAAPILSFLTIGVLFSSLYQVPQNLQTATGWTGLTLRLMAVMVVFMVPMVFWLVPIHGGIAAAGTWALVNFFLLVTGVPLQHRRLLPGEFRRWLLADTLLPLGAAALIVGLAWPLRPALSADRWTWLGFCAVTGFFAVSVSALAADTVRPRLWALLARFRPAR